MKKQYIQPELNVHNLRFESDLMRISKVMGTSYDVNETPTETEGPAWDFSKDVLEDDGLRPID